MDQIKARLHAIDRWLKAHRTTRIMRSAVLGFFQHDALQSAGSMAYFSVLSMFQLLVLGVVVLSFVVDQGEARRFIIDQIQSGTPLDADAIGGVIDAVIDSRGGITIVGFVLLLWSALGVFSALSTGVSRAFSDAPKRGFLADKLVGLLLLGVTGVLAIGSVATGVVTGILQEQAASVLAAIPGGGWALAGIGLVVPLVLIFIAFLLVYRVVPNRKVTFAEVWPGALAATLLWTVLRFGFTYYATGVARYDSAFGPISTAITLLAFLYFASVVVLLGAEFARASAVDDEALAAEAREAALARAGGMPAPALAPSGLAVPVSRRPWKPRTWALMAAAAIAGAALGRRSKRPPGSR
ncbi:MAG: YihY/virulence factor BrkB family protein [Chloroflexota bacterium]